ncbi:MAG: type IV pilin protein [Xenophilus sp.]
MTATRARGFTLVEAMVVAALIAVLAAIALPGYRDSVRRGSRAEARTALLQAAQWLERVATATGTYLPTDKAGDFPAALGSVPSKTYLIRLEGTDDAGRGYLLKAVPQGGQAGDRCGTFTLAHDSTRGVEGATAGADECWGR